MESNFSNEIQGILTSLTKIFAPFWEDDNSIIKSVYEDNRIIVHFATRVQHGYSILTLKKLGFLQTVLKTGYFKTEFYLSNGTFSFILDEEISENNLNKLKDIVIILRQYYS